MSDSASFADLVRQQRKALDLTQAELARAAGCAVVTIKRIEQGTLRPSRLLAERLATALAVSPVERARFVRSARTRLHPVAPNATPYKGLHAFQESDAADFFGRAALVERLGERLAAGGLLAVVGPSGSGKSSVVHAGLIPALRRAAASQQRRLILVEMLPGAHPFDALRAALFGALPRAGRQRLTGIAHDARFVSRALRRALPTDDQTEALLFIDQFEELFTLCVDDAERTAFLDGIAHTIATMQQSMRVVITLRADFFDRPLHHRAFSEWLRDGVEFVLPLSDDEVRLAVVEPAARAGVTVEPALAATLIRDVSNRSGALPLLQYTLTELFERRTGARMTLAAYEALGGIAGALANRADAIYQTLSPQAQDAVRQVFLHLVHPGEAMDDTRQRVRIARLAGDHVGEVLAQYGAARLLTFDRNPTSAEPTVEIAHEALFSAGVVCATGSRLAATICGFIAGWRLQRTSGTGGVALSTIWLLARGWRTSRRWLAATCCSPPSNARLLRRRWRAARNWRRRK
jgi:Helix-turn-helix.